MKYEHILEVTAKQWRDKANGNSYFSCRVTLDDVLIAVLPYQYGYGNHYEDMALDAIKKTGLLPVNGGALWSFCDNNKTKLISIKIEGCNKSEVKDWGIA